MPYVSSNYDKNPDAPLGNWVGLDKGVPYHASKSTVFHSKAPGQAQPSDEGRPGTFYGECVSYVKAVTPRLPATKEWKKGDKIHPESQQSSLTDPAVTLAKSSARQDFQQQRLGQIRPGDPLQTPEPGLSQKPTLPTIAPARTFGPGTVIATFDKTGKYSGHAAILESADNGGIHVVDQWIRGENPAPVHRRLIRYRGGHVSTDVNDGDNYYVVE